MSSGLGGGMPRVAVVGGGLWGRNHVRNYAEIGALAGIVDRDAKAAAELAEKHGSRALSFEEALADPAIDGLVFALPPSQNFPFGRRALEAGKHLFVEKPMTMTIAEGEELCALADRLDRRLMVGHILQYHPAYREMERIAFADYGLAAMSHRGGVLGWPRNGLAGAGGCCVTSAARASCSSSPATCGPARRR